MSGKQQKKGGGGDVCANPGCSKIGGGFKRCVRCQRVKYCSGKCSKAHWKNGHKKQCKSWTAQNARDAARGSVSGEGAGAGAGAGAIAEPPSMKAPNTPECPICVGIVVDPTRSLRMCSAERVFIRWNRKAAHRLTFALCVVASCSQLKLFLLNLASCMREGKDCPPGLS